MTKQPRNAIIGAFVVGAVALAVLGMLFFGAGGLFEERMQFSMAFDSSVKGLRIGSPVNFRGVHVGQVTDIKVTVDPKSLDFQVQVDVETKPDAILPSEGAMGMLKRLNRYKVVDELIKKGLRARLQMQSFVTGQLIVDMDLFPETEAQFVGRKLTHKELPTISSSLNELTKAVGEVPIKKLVESAIHAVEGVEKIVNSPALASAIVKLDRSLGKLEGMVDRLDATLVPMADNFDGAIRDARRLISEVNQQVAPIGQRIQQMTDSADRTLRTAERTLASADKTMLSAETTMLTINDVVDQDSQLQYELRQTLRELAAAARSIRVLADTLEQQPDILLRGKNGSGEK